MQLTNMRQANRALRDEAQKHGYWLRILYRDIQQGRSKTRYYVYPIGGRKSLRYFLDRDALIEWCKENARPRLRRVQPVKK